MCRQTTALSVLCVALAWATPSNAEVIADWSICAPSIVGAGRASTTFGAGPSTQVDLASVYLAMHDAIQAYDRRFEPYVSAFDEGTPGSAIAAAARAAHTVLVTKFPAQQSAIDACYATSMTGVSLTAEELDASDIVGNIAGSNVLWSRNGDGSFPSGPTPFTGGMAPGQWRLNPGTASMVAPWLGDVRPFAIDGMHRCEADPLPALTSIEYAEAYNEVKAVGSANSTVRTPEQGHIGRMYSGNFVGQFNRLMRELAAAYIGGADLASLGDRARLFALVNVAGADAIICSWHAKTKFNFWRPLHGIRNGGADGNILTEADPAWTSYMPTPNYPDYTSGANNFGGSMSRALALFFGSDKPFDAPFRIYALGGAVPLLPGDATYLEYSRFSDIAQDIVDGRIYLGIHYRFADTEAASQGRRVANDVFRSILQPVVKK